MQLVQQELEIPLPSNNMQSQQIGGNVYFNKYRPTKLGYVDQSIRQNMVTSDMFVTTPQQAPIQASQYNPDFFVSTQKPITQLGNLVQSSRQNDMLTDANNRAYGNYDTFDDFTSSEYEYNNYSN